MDVENNMDIFFSANFFIHNLDIKKIFVRTLDEKKDSDWIISIGCNACLWFDTEKDVIAFADRILSIIKATEIKEKVNSETNT